MTIFENTYGQTESVATLKEDIPLFLLKNDTNLGWINEQKLLNTEEKKVAIAIMKKTDFLFSYLDTSFEYSEDSIAKSFFLMDINFDDKKDLILYALLPACNFQPFILIAINKDDHFERIFQREGDFISWNIKPDTIGFQIFIQGCCSDHHGYISDYHNINGKVNLGFDPIKKLDKESEIFWSYGSEHPSATDSEMNVIVIKKDSTILLPFTESNRNDDCDLKEEINWVFYKGETGNLISEKVNGGESWCYIKMPVKENNSPIIGRKRNSLRGSIYGWTKKENIK